MAVIEHVVPYKYDGRSFEGVLVYDDSIKDQRPAIFMQPDWLGVCSHTIAMAAEAAKADYVILLADMFGKDYGGMNKTNEELGKVARANRADIDFILGCSKVANDTLTAEADRLELIDNSRKGAVGYCMGGGYLLEQIRDGADLELREHGSVLQVNVADDAAADDAHSQSAHAECSMRRPSCPKRCRFAASGLSASRSPALRRMCPGNRTVISPRPSASM